MTDAQLLAEILKLAPFESAEDARLALISTMETLGFLLPEPLVAELETVLPQDCTGLLALGVSVRQHHPRVRAEKAAALSLKRHTLEGVQEICRVLGMLLTPELVARLIAHLPAQLSEAFDGRMPHTPPQLRTRPLRVSTSLPSRHLGEDDPGRESPLYRTRPPSVHAASVASENPHGDSKLSSAHGATQEHEQKTLADTWWRPGNRS
jgi:uncharacterized protein (DUF2267 family)